jgi:hypothetical protein
MQNLIHHSCESQQRICHGTNIFDPDSEKYLSAWHSVCDQRSPLKPTTPVLSSITQAPSHICPDAIVTACQSATELIKCGVTTGGSEQVSSCSCQPSLLAQAWSCSYLGNLTCFETAASTENLPGYGYCSNFGNVISSLAVSILPKLCIIRLKASS